MTYLAVRSACAVPSDTQVGSKITIHFESPILNGQFIIHLLLGSNDGQG